jgi:predicted AAA+ superfamily ATPase
MACDELTMRAFNKNISDAFKSLIKSGRPDIKDENDKNLIPLLYVDLFENDYILNQVLDDNHVILRGRKGTGKSTIFLQADNQLKKKKGNLPIYINLQSVMKR